MNVDGKSDDELDGVIGAHGVLTDHGKTLLAAAIATVAAAESGPHVSRHYRGTVYLEAALQPAPAIALGKFLAATYRTASDPDLVNACEVITHQLRAKGLRFD